ncbi:hypothetical protein BOTBODRAFT_68789 [Botryobasidium botryosum FD-172 SS1]|uniref:F-box domain-containing protein n=1 Tax=Botryobasidium botryosum (strain FD-172 SS1) TaxID=930990 RepID=A0A067MEN7_BOTB1|nr:hypothetical protein BOTBODRAFT_68789 [Botryobasidium botryosum FD-172 SS1]
MVELPDALRQTLVDNVLSESPDLALTFLSSMGHRYHESAVSTLFGVITLPDDARLFLPEPLPLYRRLGPLSALLENVTRYGPFVRKLEITDPVILASGDGKVSASLFELDDESEGQSDRINDGSLRPIPADKLNYLLGACSNLEELAWLSTTPPPDGIFETLASTNSKLTTFSFNPMAPLLSSRSMTPCSPFTLASRPTAIRYSAPSLPLFAPLPLTSLHLTRLSQQGARAFSELLHRIGEFSALETMKLDFVWLDDALCERIVEAGRKLRALSIGTSGTKLTDKGVVALLGGCDVLEDFALVEVEGRLSRTLWTKVDTLPPALHTFRVSFSESGPHHSWTADHLQSLPSLAFDPDVLKHLYLTRLVHPLEQERPEPADDMTAVKPIPKDVVKRLKEAKALEVLECDWWSWKPEDVKELLEGCTKLITLKIAFDAPFAKLLNLASSFAALSQFQKLQVTILPQHAPSPPPSPAIRMLPTPGGSPITLTRPMLSPSKSSFAEASSITNSPLASSVLTLSSSFTEYPMQPPLLSPSDLALPLLRDIRKFARRCSKLTEIEWYGRTARGSWVVTRGNDVAPSVSSASGAASGPTATAPTTVGTTLTSATIAPRVEHVPPPPLSEDVWERIRWEEDAARLGWAPPGEREGQVWEGAAAEEMREDREREEMSAVAQQMGEVGVSNGNTNGNGGACGSGGGGGGPNVRSPKGCANGTSGSSGRMRKPSESGKVQGQNALGLGSKGAEPPVPAAPQSEKVWRRGRTSPVVTTAATTGRAAPRTTNRTSEPKSGVAGDGSVPGGRSARGKGERGRGGGSRRGSGAGGGAGRKQNGGTGHGGEGRGKTQSVRGGKPRGGRSESY